MNHFLWSRCPLRFQFCWRKKLNENSILSTMCRPFYSLQQSWMEHDHEHSIIIIYAPKIELRHSLEIAQNAGMDVSDRETKRPKWIEWRPLELEWNHQIIFFGRVYQQLMKVNNQTFHLFLSFFIFVWRQFPKNFIICLRFFRFPVGLMCPSSVAGGRARRGKLCASIFFMIFLRIFFSLISVRWIVLCSMIYPMNGEMRWKKAAERRWKCLLRTHTRK